MRETWLKQRLEGHEADVSGYFMATDAQSGLVSQTNSTIRVLTTYDDAMQEQQSSDQPN